MAIASLQHQELSSSDFIRAWTRYCKEKGTSQTQRPVSPQRTGDEDQVSAWSGFFCLQPPLTPPWGSFEPRQVSAAEFPRILIYNPLRLENAQAPERDRRGVMGLARRPECQGRQ